MGLQGGRRAWAAEAVGERRADGDVQPADEAGEERGLGLGLGLRLGLWLGLGLGVGLGLGSRADEAGEERGIGIRFGFGFGFWLPADEAGEQTKDEEVERGGVAQDGERHHGHACRSER